MGLILGLASEREGREGEGGLRGGSCGSSFGRVKGQRGFALP